MKTEATLQKCIICVSVKLSMPFITKWIVELLGLHSVSPVVVACTLVLGRSLRKPSFVSRVLPCLVRIEKSPEFLVS
jgi:hypothetical protein